MTIAPRARKTGPRFLRPTHRLTTAERGYDSKNWRPFRDRYVARKAIETDFVCAHCKRSLVRLYMEDKRAIHVDHIVPHRGDPVLMYDESNLQVLCASCHGKKTASEDGGFGHARPHARRDQPQ